MKTIERCTGDFLYDQVAALINEMANSGTLRVGDKLPSLRGLSERLGVSVPTVRQAYLELERQGLIEARPKSGYFWRTRSANTSPPRKAAPPKKPYTVNRQTLIEQVFDAIHAPGSIPLGSANPSTAHPADKGLARIMRRVLSSAGSRAVSYGPIHGYFPLQRQLAMRYLEYGLQVDPDEVLITNGAQEAIAIALQCVAQPGDVIAVESPTYFGVLELIESLGMMALEIPLCPEQGIDPDDVAKALTKHSVTACVFSTSISNPMGSFMIDERRRRLVNLLEQNEIPLIEDDVYGDLHFGPERGTPARCYSRKGLVLSASSFSKTVAPGYRIGWLLASKFQAKAKRIKRALSCSSSLLNQWTLAEFVASGEYDRAIRSLRQVLLTNRQKAIELVNDAFPSATRSTSPQGGGVLWLELPKSNDGTAIFHKALEQGISVTPGALFSSTDKFKHCIRLSYGMVWDDEVERAFRAIGSMILD